MVTPAPKLPTRAGSQLTVCGVTLTRHCGQETHKFSSALAHEQNVAHLFYSFHGEFQCLDSCVTINWQMKWRMCLVFVPGSWEGAALSPWKVSVIHGGPWDLVSMRCLMAGPWIVPGWALATLEDQSSAQRFGHRAMAITPISREGRGAGDWIQVHGQWFNQSCLLNKSPLKTLDSEAWVSFLVGDKHRCARRGSVQRIWMVYIWDPPRPHPGGLSFWMALICHPSELSNPRG